MIEQGNPLALQLSPYGSFSNREQAVLDQFHHKQRIFPKGKELVHEGQAAPSAYILYEGWASSFKLMPDGGRQIIDFSISGDFLGLRSVFFRTSNHSIVSITDIKASQVTADDLYSTFGSCPRLATSLLRAASMDKAIAVERLVSLGRRNAPERMAHFLLELGERLMVVGLATEKGYDCPLSQFHLADALGLSAVHVNRVLRDFREEGLLTFRAGRVVYHDIEKLVRFCGFDNSYISQIRRLLT
ncbi:Crp/Fnr family transcriptional regulator [Oceaniovalibus sp. ACAM 378]|uniref:Crp/Fnr family transcriptional regulator n=1 Tax=Oceaniovalibus sp. ACAM 378 TaxID=2599923 RepID=UPI0011DA8F47|nr:Crp/Fnr family transcriptional regulator [Oceaniovalibus sp. ACAM 378]TYB84342.1 Crp/Fnr family transcriptional regulator [Oceaniovalibus sp. ACAM 378]